MRKYILTSCTLICYLFLLMTTVATAKLVFTSNVDGKNGIYIMDDNGDNKTLLTDVLEPWLPRWSPDGKQIVFARQVKDDDHRQSHLFLMNSDGTNVRQLTPPIDGWDSQPSFSPDGKSVIFSRTERNDDGYKDSINLVDIVSGQVKQISDLDLQNPLFSPNGKEIVCVPTQTIAAGGGNIVIMDIKGNNVREILKPAEQNPPLFSVSRDFAVWSPDGKQIIYTEFHFSLKMVGNTLHQVPKGFFYLICNRNGQLVKRLKISKKLRPMGIDWMDNGESIVFCAWEAKLEEVNVEVDDPPCHIYKYNISSEKTTRLTNDHVQNYHIDWISDDVLPVSPQGKKKVTWGTLKK